MADPTPVQSPAPFSTWLGVLLLFGLFGAMVLAIVGPAPRSDTYEKMRTENRLKKLKDARDEDAKALGGYAWIDKNKGTVRLPIERAMELTIAELANKKPAAAGPIATPAPSAAPGAAAAASPSASASQSGTPKPTSVAGQTSAAGGQPAAAVSPPPAPPKTQPGASASPAASPKSSAAVPTASAPPNE